jgi:hypothetical protein
MHPQLAKALSELRRGLPPEDTLPEAPVVRSLKGGRMAGARQSG